MGDYKKELVCQCCLLEVVAGTGAGAGAGCIQHQAPVPARSPSKQH